MKKILKACLLSCTLLTGFSTFNLAANSPEQVATDYSQIEEFFVVSAGFKEYQGKPAAWVGLSKPIKQNQSLNLNIDLTSKEQLVDGGWVLDDTKTNLYFPGLTPEQSYTIKVRANLTSFQDEKLGDVFQSSFTTPKVQPSASFLQSGSILNPSFSEGLPIVVVNLNYVDVEFYRLSEEQYRSVLTQKATAEQRSYRIQSIIKQAELVYSRKYQTKADKNQKQQLVLSTTGIEALKEPGVYMAFMRGHGEYGKAQTALFNVSQLALEVREYKERYLLTVYQQQSAQPQSDVKITLFDRKGRQIDWAESTNAQGQVFIDKSLSAVVATASSKGDFNLIDLTSYQKLNLTDFVTTGRNNLPVEIFSWGARDLYRRGEMLEYYALLRDQDGQRVADFPIKAELVSADGKSLNQTILQPDADGLGLYSYRYQLADEVATGQYKLLFKLNDKIYRHNFTVEDFMPERMAIEIIDDKTLLEQAGDAQQAVKALYLYGAPASDNRMDGNVAIRTTENALADHPGFYFGDNSKLGQLDYYAINTVNTNVEGQANLTIADKWSRIDAALEINGYANLYESGGRKVTKKFTKYWWPHSSLIGIKPSFEKLTSEQNSLADFSLIRAKQSGQLIKDDVLVSLVWHKTSYLWQHNERGGWQRIEQVETIPVWQKSQQITDVLKVSLPVKWGKYQLIVKSKKDGRTSKLFFNAGPDWYSYWAQDHGNQVKPDQITLAFDQAGYQNNDVGKVKLHSPYQGQGWLRIEAEDLLYQQAISVNKGENLIEFPVGDWQQHNIYLSAVVVSPASKNNQLQRALGLVHLPLAREQRQLTVAIDTPETTKPDQTLNVAVKVEGSSENTKVVLAAVDVGILNLYGYKMPSPFDYFFARRAYPVVLRDNFNQIIAANDLTKANILWGGGAALSHGGQQAAAQVQLVSFLSKPTAVDANGMANVAVPIPYFNGKLKLVAVAFDANKFGANSAETKVADKLVSQINLPRFIAVGDTATGVIDLANTSQTDMDLALTLQATGIKAELANSQVSVEPGQRIKVNFKLDARDAIQQLAELNLAIKQTNQPDQTTDAEPFQLTRIWKLAVRHPYPAERQYQQFQLSAGDKQQLQVNLENWHQQVQSSIQMSNRPDFALAEQISRLFAFPLGCLEQTSSRLLPWLVLPPNMREQYIDVLAEQSLSQTVQQGIDGILVKQTPSGGLSLWSNRGVEHSWLTVYATDVLLTAQEAGYAVPQEKIDLLFKRLAYFLRASSINDGYGDLLHYQFATRSYAAYILAKQRQVNLTHMHKLAEQVNHAKSPLPVIQLAAAFDLKGIPKERRKLIKQARNITYQKQYSADYNSEIRDLALSVNILLKHNLATKWAQALSFELWQKLKHKSWFNTQQRMALVLADLALAEKFSEPFNYQLNVAEAEYQGPDKQSAFYRVDGLNIQQTSIENSSKKDLFVSVISQGYPEQITATSSQQLKVERSYYDLFGNPVDINDVFVQSGQRFLVRLQVSSDKSYRDLMLVDLLPAGFEIERGDIEQHLDIHKVKFAQQSMAQLVKRSSVDYQAGRDDRFIAAINTSSHAPTDVFYIVQAVTPGEFIHPPALVESMYQADLRAVGESGRVSIESYNPALH
ncbi:alpha-2-macroglobulin-like lipoprotein [Catenovulum agarivorans DS-2]|uniref:Alpha-2-macroglobulin-like lipoprotein n=1 Tax=Catenovulum agarivorans DS-2 TaxID=1328313 RepID=W7QPE6_9ALTE|nr:MG2 domain-containing protein [Catenovulum agarivorans]EWH09763.1 alpha-2-macroglobulin-like lipoprotein [Catenovulum agarivorans DS-2]